MESFFNELRNQGIKLWLSGEALKFKAYQHAPLSNDQMGFLKQNKPSIISWLKDNPEFFSYIPLSENQKSLWLAYQLNPDSPAYNLTHAERLNESVDIELLNQAFQTLVNRHPILRTRYIDDKGYGLQTVSSEHELALGINSVNNWTESEIHQWTASQADKPFVLEQGDVCRAQILVNQKAETIETILQITVHHIAADFWSCELIFDELLNIYKTLINDPDAFLNDKEVAHDYFSWSSEQAQWLGTEEAKASRAFWQETLKNSAYALDLPTDFSRPALQTFQGEVIKFQLSEVTNNAVRACAKSLGVTPYVFCLSVYQLLLYRYSGQSQFLIGTPTSGRLKQEYQRIIGYLVNPVLIACECENNPTFRSFVEGINHHSRSVLEHQMFSYNQILDDINAPRDLSRNPLFQHMFTLTHVHENAHKDLAEFTYLSQQRGAALDISLVLLDDRKQFTGEWHYNTDLYTPETARMMIDSYLEILDAVSANPDVAIDSVEIVPKPLRDKMLIQWNQTAVDLTDFMDVTTALEKQAAKTPDRIAAVFSDEQLTYAELDKKANQLAHHIRSLNIGPEHKIVIYQRRSLSMLISLLAVLKVGAAYVPVDPSYPEDRVAFMLEDANSQLVLTDKHTQNNTIINTVESNRVVVDELLSNLSNTPDSPLAIERLPQNLAYMIYTSGSSGKPKAVQVTRHNMLNFLFAMDDCFHLSEQDRLLAVTSLSFDIAVLELFLPLFSGARVVIGPEEIARDGESLQTAITNYGINIMQATPVSWKILLTTGWQQEQKFTVLCGGESFPSDMAHQLLNNVNLDIWNLYGPTETTVWSSAYRLDPKKSYTNIPIGKPIANTQLYILDKQCNPLPVGVAGELLIGGDGVTRGYANRKELTNEKFIDSDFGRLYRTGDLARFNHDGVVECLGRLDNQVKVRGYRIELGEIETCLIEFEAVKDAVVQSYSVRDETRIAAYVIIDTALNLSEEISTTLKSFLSKFLPDYMVPSTITVLQEFPLTSNGKVDRKSLPIPDVSLEKTEYVAPITEIEKDLCEMWQELLGIEKVGINDNFFKLGGNSLAAARMVSKFKDHFNVDLPLHKLFGLSSLFELAVLIEQQQPSITEDTFNRMDDLLDELGV